MQGSLTVIKDKLMPRCLQLLNCLKVIIILTVACTSLMVIFSLIGRTSSMVMALKVQSLLLDNGCRYHIELLIVDLARRKLASKTPSSYLLTIKILGLGAVHDLTKT